METKDIPLNGPTDWRREPSERRNAVLGKLAEEASELAARCSRAMIQGLYELDPDSGRTNFEHLEDEIADVCALKDLCVLFLRMHAGRIADRRNRKFDYKYPWLQELPDTDKLT